MAPAADPSTGYAAAPAADGYNQAGYSQGGYSEGYAAAPAATGYGQPAAETYAQPATAPANYNSSYEPAPSADTGYGSTGYAAAPATATSPAPTMSTNPAAAMPGVPASLSSTGGYRPGSTARTTSGVQNASYDQNPAGSYGTYQR